MLFDREPSGEIEGEFAGVLRCRVGRVSRRDSTIVDVGRRLASMGRGGIGKTRALGDDSHLMALRSHVEKRTLCREKGGAAAPTAEALGSVKPAASYGGQFYH